MLSNARFSFRTFIFSVPNNPSNGASLIFNAWKSFWEAIDRCLTILVKFQKNSTTFRSSLVSMISLPVPTNTGCASCKKSQRPVIFVAKDGKKGVGGAGHRNIFRCPAPPTNQSVIMLQIFRRAAAYKVLAIMHQCGKAING